MLPNTRGGEINKEIDCKEVYLFLYVLKIQLLQILQQVKKTVQYLIKKFYFVINLIKYNFKKSVITSI